MSTTAIPRALWLLLPLWCLLSSGCLATTRLWEATDPHRMVLMSASEVSEAELQQSGRPYLRLREGQEFLLEQDSWQKASNYTMRSVALPFAVAADGAMIATGIIPIIIIAAPEILVALADR